MMQEIFSPLDLSYVEVCPVYTLLLWYSPGGKNEATDMHCLFYTAFLGAASAAQPWPGAAPSQPGLALQQPANILQQPASPREQPGGCTPHPYLSFHLGAGWEVSTRLPQWHWCALTLILKSCSPILLYQMITDFPQYTSYCIMRTYSLHPFYLQWLREIALRRLFPGTVTTPSE